MTTAKELQKNLTWEFPHIAKKNTAAKEAAFAYCEGYKEFLNKAKEAIEDIKSDIDQISFYAEGMADLLNGDDSGLCEAWKALKETADGLLEAFNSRAENFITVIENYYKESEQNSEEWKNKISKINEGFGEIQGFLKNRNS